MSTKSRKNVSGSPIEIDRPVEKDEQDNFTAFQAVEIPPGAILTVNLGTLVGDYLDDVLDGMNGWEEVPTPGT